MTVTAPLLRLLANQGYGRYLRTDETPAVAYAAMRRLFAADPAAFERLAARTVDEHPLLTGLDPTVGVAAGEVDSLVERLRVDGLAVLSARLPETECVELEAVARAGACVLTGGGSTAPSHARFDPDAPVAVRYDLDEADLVQHPVVQRLLADQSLLALAQAYLGAAPIQDLVAMWWSTAQGSAPSSGAAQLFHFDLDRLRFLKVFVYVTDVDDDTGPHSIVRGTHRHLPAAFREPRRYDDADVLERFGDDVIEVCGPRGTVFVADTRALHRGRRLVRGHRLVFQLECTTSLFGAPVQRLAVRTPVPALADVVHRFGPTFRRFALA
jgi:hypothetical protein